MRSRSSWVARCRPPRGLAGPIARTSDPERLEAFRTDAACVPGGHTPEVCFPESEAAIAAVLAGAERVLVVGAQSSLTGGATPRGETVLSTARLQTIGPAALEHVVVGPGVVLAELARELEARGQCYPLLGLDHAVWGHLSDGNLHPNVLPRRAEDGARAHTAQLAIGTAAIALGGSPLSEHGVGRNPVKRELLRRLYGEAGLAAMRAVKHALGPREILAPGVIFGPGSV